LRDSGKSWRQQSLHFARHLARHLAGALALAATVPAQASWRAATISDPGRGAIGQVAATEGTITYRGGRQPALLILDCADGQTALSLTTADLYFGNGRSQVQWSVDGSKLEMAPWSTCSNGDCLSMRGERAVTLARDLMAAGELKLIVDRGFGRLIDARFDVKGGAPAISAVGRRCGWLTEPWPPPGLKPDMKKGSAASR
jgi:hypothetical protein